MTEKQLIEWLRGEMERADKDYEMATETDWADYHQGEHDAYAMVLAVMGATNEK